MFSVVPLFPVVFVLFSIWQCINIQDMEQAMGGHWNLGILREDSGGDIREY